jgi:hypothetical protein
MALIKLATPATKVPAKVWVMFASLSPSPEPIDLNMPPVSPVQIAGSGTLELQAMIHTPLKVSQGIHPRRGVKRRRTEPADVHTDPSVSSCNNSSDPFGDYSTEPVGDSCRAAVSDILGSTIGSGTSNVPTPRGMEDSEQAELPVDSFEHYVDAVLADCAGFFQIGKILFVVQGWDTKWQRSTVG